MMKSTFGSMLFAAAVAVANAQHSAFASRTMDVMPSGSGVAGSSTTPSSAGHSIPLSATSTSSGPGTTVIQLMQAVPSDVVPAIFSQQLAAARSGLAGSIVDANALATTVAIDCLPDALSCPLQKPYTVTSGSSTFTKHNAVSTVIEGATAVITIDDDCDISASTHVACTNSMSASVSALGQHSATQTVITTTYSPDAITYVPLPITAGIYKLNRPQATQTPTNLPNAAAGRAGAGIAAGAAFAGAVAGFF